jgi:uncharacterized protein YggE
MARQHDYRQLFMSLWFVALAIFTAGASAHETDSHDSQQHPIGGYTMDPMTSTIHAMGSSLLKPSSFDASARMKTKTSAEVAIVQIHVETKAASEAAAIALARARRQEIEDLIQSLSDDTSKILMRADYVGGGGLRSLLGGQRKASKCEEAPNSVAATGRLNAKFTDFAALQKFVTTVGDDQDVSIQNLEWKLTPATRKTVRRGLRGDALAELNRVGKEYEEAFGVVLNSMYDYSESSPRGDCFKMYDGDDDDDGVSMSSDPIANLHGWDTIRDFFAADDNKEKEDRVGKVSTVLHVNCKFGTLQT